MNDPKGTGASKRPAPGRSGLPHSLPLESLVVSGPDALFVVDERGTILFANDQAEWLFGYRSAEVVGQPVEILLPEPLRRSHERLRAGYVQAPRLRLMGESESLTARRKDGVEFPVEISLSPIEVPGGVVVAACVRDVTRRWELQREAEAQTARAEAADSAKSRFLAAASHDLRQPLQAAIIYARVLQDHIGEDGEPILSKLASSLDSLAELMSKLLDVSRLESGSIRPEPTIVSIGLLLERLADELRPQAEAKGLGFRVRPTRFRVRSDPQLLEQILQNLISNAIRHTVEGRVLVGCRRRGSEIGVQVWDTGVGIPEEESERIFAEFYQIKRGSHHLGLGLGLSIVKRVADLLGHPVMVRSEPGRGTCFEVRVPMTMAEGPSSVGPARPQRGGKGRRVLLVDDEEEVLDALATCLERDGYRVDRCADVPAALALLGETYPEPDLLVTDYILGGELTGVDLAESLHRRWRGNPPTVVLSGDSSSEVAEIVGRAGLELLYKPVNPEDLLALLETLARDGAR